MKLLVVILTHIFLVLKVGNCNIFAVYMIIVVCSWYAKRL